MSVTDDEEAPAIATALPSHVAEKRDALGNVCFYLHFAVMIFIVTGWLMPFHGALVFSMCFLPAVAVQGDIRLSEQGLLQGGWNREIGYIALRQQRDLRRKPLGFGQ